MIKIDFKDLPDTTTPVDADNLNQLQENVEDAIDNVSIDLDSQVSTTSTNGVENQAITNYVNNLIPDIYSTTETKTNKVWINGETIYRKVIDIGNLADSATVTTYDTGLTFSQTKFIKIDIIAQSSGAAFSIPFHNQTTTSQSIEATIDSSGKVRIITYGDRSAYKAIAILEYIKSS